MGESPGETSVTIKYGKNYEDTWATFKGTPAQVRQQVAEFFGMDPQATAGLTLAQLVFNATGMAHAMTTLQNAFPAMTAIPAHEAGKPGPQGDPWQAAQGASPSPATAGQVPAEEISPSARVLAEIESAATVTDLKRIWATNREAFKDPSVSSAYQTKGRALKSNA